MLIKAITIENFKGISAPVRIEFKPITLLFGANSCGKSSIIQALHYIREVLEFRRLDVDKTTAGGDFIDLGGFDNFVHGHDLTRKIRFRIEVDKISDSYFKDRGLLFEDDADGEELYGKLAIKGKKCLDITIAKHGDDVIVERISVVINNVLCLTLIVEGDRFEAMGMSGDVIDVSPFENIEDIVTARPLLARIAKDSGLSMDTDFQIENGKTIHFFSINDEGEITSSDKQGALNFLLYFVKQRTLLPNVAKFIQEPIKRNWGYDDYVSAAFETALFGMIGTIVDDLKTMLYVGPLRQIPPRNYLAQQILHESRWANGLAAWDRASYAPKIIPELNKWLGKQHLDTGYQLESNCFFRIPADAINNAQNLEEIRANLPEQEGKVDLVQESDGLKVSLYDVGVGISQVFPVVVAALEEKRFTIIEQPELHIHPRLQVELGDLFINAVRKDKCMLIETHSEHLLLRLLRRVRQYSRNKAMQEMAITPEQLSIIYLEKSEKSLTARYLAVSDDGDSYGPWPEGFFEERAEELY